MDGDKQQASHQQYEPEYNGVISSRCSVKITGSLEFCSQLNYHSRVSMKLEKRNQTNGNLSPIDFSERTAKGGTST